jgi:hypothetical protein
MDFWGTSGANCTFGTVLILKLLKKAFCAENEGFVLLLKINYINISRKKY